ncbi:hypothetical protein GRI75_05685 [Altererythrobacter soli]|uniref:Uncharacterized protein n=1 Tax=Croceibacterium soli TaxID=1739690 RepID=A0A6I4URR3_9SPHN|nr:DUF6152 family protein [Croceibacterium soli]MXP41136.1 hypothetical protein [Croceibacterium soli]
MASKFSRLALAGGVALAGMAAFSVPGTAHHSTAMFEWGKEVQLSNATVRKWEWTNPHTFLFVTTIGKDGKEERWAFEGMSPNHLSRAGWSKRSLKPGDKVDLTYYALRDPRKGGFNVMVKKADGTELKQLPSR